MCRVLPRFQPKNSQKLLLRFLVFDGMTPIYMLSLILFSTKCLSFSLKGNFWFIREYFKLWQRRLKKGEKKREEENSHLK